MEPGFPKRGLITDRGNSVNYGGDGRYLYIPNRADRTISVIDTLTDTVITTISLVSFFTSGTFDGTWYRSKSKQIIAIQSSIKHIVIDADPSSASFNTIVDTFAIPFGYYSFNGTCIYDQQHDLMNGGAAGNIGLDLKNKIRNYNGSTIPIGKFITSPSIDCYLAHRSLMQCGSGNSVVGLASTMSSDLIFILRPAAALYNGITFVIKNSLYQYHGTLQKFNINKNDLEHIATLANSTFPLAYDSSNNCIIGTGGTGGEAFVTNLTNFVGLGTVQARSRAANELNNAFRVIYSEFSKKVYLHCFNNTTATTGCDRVHVYDLSLPLASSYLGFINVGNNCVATNTCLLTNPVAKNRLYTNEFI